MPETAARLAVRRSSWAHTASAWAWRGGRGEELGPGAVATGASAEPDPRVGIWRGSFLSLATPEFLEPAACLADRQRRVGHRLFHRPKSCSGEVTKITMSRHTDAGILASD